MSAEKMTSGQCCKKCLMLLVLVLASASNVFALDIDVALLGDSNTWIAGENCEKDTGWPFWFKQGFAPRSCSNLSRSGATWVNTENTRYDIKENIEVLGDNNVIYNQVNRLIDEVKRGTQPTPQLIIVAAGVNDVWFAKKRPHAMDVQPLEAYMRSAVLKTRHPSRVLSLSESIVYSAGMLRDAFPRAAVVLVTPVETVNCAPHDIHQASDVMEETARLLGWGVVRLDRLSPVKSEQEKAAFNYTYDGTHTSVLGAREHARIIVDALNEIMMQKKSQRQLTDGIF